MPSQVQIERALARSTQPFTLWADRRPSWAILHGDVEPSAVREWRRRRGTAKEEVGERHAAARAVMVDSGSQAPARRAGPKPRIVLDRTPPSKPLYRKTPNSELQLWTQRHNDGLQSKQVLSKAFAS